MRLDRSCRFFSPGRNPVLRFYRFLPPQSRAGARPHMAVRIEAHAEPIPGYTLIDRIGAGGFGEVWKCEAPGGLLKAVKIISGSVSDCVKDESRLNQELKSLHRVKSIRHPYI